MFAANREGAVSGLRCCDSLSEDRDVFALTCYDQFGRLSKATNPFGAFNGQNCASANGTSDIYWTTNTYDAAGRPWKVTTPDNAVVEGRG